MEGADCGILLIQNARWTFPKNTKTFFNKRLFKERVRLVLLNKTTNHFQAWERRGVPLFKMGFLKLVFSSFIKICFWLFVFWGAQV